MKYMHAMPLFAVIAAQSALAFAQDLPAIQASWSFENAASGQKFFEEAEFGASESLVRNEAGTLVATDAVVEKTVYLAKVGERVREALREYEKFECRSVHPYPYPSPYPPHPGHRMPPPPREDDCKAQREKIASRLQSDLVRLQRKFGAVALSDGKVKEALAVLEKLVKNMREGQAMRNYPYPRQPFPGTPPSIPMPPPGMPSGAPMPAPMPAPAPVGMPPSAPSAPGTLTAGGAKDFGHFKMLVNQGAVPNADSFPVEGFLSEFTLAPMTPRQCEKLLCVRPLMARDDAERVYVQLDLGTNLDPATFKRPPLNLSIVLDISGSMGADDGTGRSRLEWAKDSLRETVRQLNSNDILSIVLFETGSRVLLPAQKLADKGAILDLIDGIRTEGSTNLEAGLRDGYEEVLRNVRPGSGYENRVILISDAGLNTGVIDETELLRLVTESGDDSVGLTAIGMGDNFNEKFIHTISRSRGGNYIFVNSGRGLLDYYKNFDFLVTPVAYSFKASLDFPEWKGKLVHAYGIPARADAPLRDVIDIRTLFLAGSGGGAILLEFAPERR